MKRNLLTILATLMLFSSCSTHYVVTDSVSRRLNGKRVILSADTTTLAQTPFGSWKRSVLASPQCYDFRTTQDTMRYAYSQCIAANGWTLECDTLSRLLRPVVEVKKKFRWFSTRYCYSAFFHRLDSLPVPVSKYLTEDEQRLLFCNNEMPTDWNGADLYALLDRLNSKYMEWWSHCYFEKEYELYYRYADDSQRTLLTQYHDTLLTLVQKSQTDHQASLEQIARIFPELDFISKELSSYDIQNEVAKWLEKSCEIDIRVLWRVALPGSATHEYLISGERLIMGDYGMQLSSRVINWWAIAITMLLAIVPLIVVFRPNRRCNLGRN